METRHLISFILFSSCVKPLYQNKAKSNMILTQDHVPTTLYKDEAEVRKNLAWKRNCSISSA